MNTHSYLNPGNHPYPHIGNMIRKKIFDLNLTASEAARRLGVASSTVHAYYQQPSLQLGIIWKLSIALQYDFLSDIITQYPENFPVKVDDKIAEQEKELEILRGLLRR